LTDLRLRSWLLRGAGMWELAVLCALFIVDMLIFAALVRLGLNWRVALEYLKRKAKDRER